MTNRKWTYRFYIELGMQVRTKRSKKLVRPRIPMAVSTPPNERWCMDVVSDQLACGRRIRILNIVDDYSRVCVGQLVDVSISGARITRFLDQLRGLHKIMVMNNGPEVTSKTMSFYGQKTKVNLHFYSGRQADSEYIYRKFQRQILGWFFEPALVPGFGRCPTHY